MPHVSAEAQTWPLAQAFAISRGIKTEAHVVVVTLIQDGAVGRGECVPYARYGESVESVLAEVDRVADTLRAGADRSEIQEMLAPGAARNAIDCALWDLEAKRSGAPVWRLAGLEKSPVALTTAYTISLGSPEEMARSAAANAHRPLMKLKLTGAGDLERVAAVREAAPATALIVDANEGWSIDMVEPFSAALARLGVELIEQPLPADRDEALASVVHPVPICADESAHSRAGLAALVGRYDAINIKLDKTGGLTEALALKDAALLAGLDIMVGCMVGTSLSMAPAFLLAQGARFVDLDGPLLLGRDRDEGFRFDGSIMHPPQAALWG